MMRLACDTGGTFTDLVVEDGDEIRLFKASTTPDDPVRGVLDALALAAQHDGVDRSTFLSRASMFVHGTTRAINAILTGNTARTAFLTTEGHPDVLVMREGGRIEPFNFTVPYPEPYVPRRLTFEVPERIDAEGRVVKPLDEAAVLGIIERLRALDVEAVGVCLLWSVLNSAHERRIGELLAQHLPNVSVTLSHVLNPTLREYRRASATVIDASLKPLMFKYLNGLTNRLREAGFTGRTLMVTSGGGIMDAEAVARAPIHSINSGPAMAPVAGRFYAERDVGNAVAIVADTGGTSYDVSLVRDGRIPWTRETWLGQRFRGHMTGFPSVDVKSIGAGGGSIAWVDSGGLLRVGPKSAGSTPGPVAYGKGGTEPTVTDCSLILGYIDPDFFLGGAMALDRDAAVAALKEKVASKLGLSVEEAAASVLALATEKMVGAIDEITVNQGIDPTSAVLVGGGGAAGLNAVAVGRRLGCASVLIPEAGAVLSAAGALMSELSSDYAQMLFATSARFSFDKVNEVLARLAERCAAFAAGPGEGALETVTEFSVEARYPHQIWEIEVPMASGRINNAAELDALKQAFHATHKSIFEISDPNSEVEFVTWRAKVQCRLREGGTGRLPVVKDTGAIMSRRPIYFASTGWVDAPVARFEAMEAGEPVAGPAIIESSFTTVVVDPGAVAVRTPGGGLRVGF
ncbi:MAG TPA: hydantoinase/oxoprolinase family protein [Geminicoccus sp.]|jgi:N-methylhydantoinase A|uniref:hydantoinase/oxoprolinase family protein n=1 Tax=Geminicoccus sp. TaxID=2024832 RepID=UPI002E33A506|nr:hydantoinase/oxoprolinase family protein [Geminicoccus sp.]HEX2528234.1 hydantoinase/oxoprolinase family protein [Geminicoccus sp.]